jgi:uncharacterized repeat protein (TIGR03843 family)
LPEDERQQRPAHLSGEEWLELLSGGSIEIEGRLPWSSNYSFLVTVSSEGESRRAVYKPGRGERPLYDFGPELFRREVACYELSAAYDLGLVPETVLRLDGPLEAGSVQRFVEADFEQHYFTLIEDEANHDCLRGLAGFDVLCNNADRKSGHVLVDEAGHIWGIDNGLCFHVRDKLRTVVWDFAGQAVPERLIEVCRSLIDDGVPAKVAALIDEKEATALVRRARRLLSSGLLPTPVEDYRSYPWPLV